MRYPQVDLLPKPLKKGRLGPNLILWIFLIFQKKGQICLRNSHDEDRTKRVVDARIAIVSATIERARTGTIVVGAAPIEPSIITSESINSISIPSCYLI